MPDARILLADSDATVANTISWVLKEHGHEVVVAHNEVDVLQALETAVPDLVLLDVLLPGCDGFALLERMTSDPRWRDVTVIVASALPSDEGAARALGLGADDFIRKPFRVKELVARVRSQLRQRAVLRTASDALRMREKELARARSDVEQQRELTDILRDVGGDLSSGEIYHMLARRVARVLNLTHCSLILAGDDERPRVIATAFERGVADGVVGGGNAPDAGGGGFPGGSDSQGIPIDLDEYPEIRNALTYRRPILVENVQASALYAAQRARWKQLGVQSDVHSVIAIPFELDAVHTGVFFLRRNVGEPALTRNDMDFAESVVVAAVAALKRAATLEYTRADNRRLEQLALTDPLTTVLNRRALAERLHLEMGRVRRYESMVSVLLIDVDHFKQVNDTYGHLAGDDVLQELAQMLQQVVRAVDIVARYGGEEFVIVLPETGTDGAASFAERIRELIESHQFASASGQILHLTGSIGVATYPSHSIVTVEDLLAQADQALYRAKAEGRNKVVV